MNKHIAPSRNTAFVTPGALPPSLSAVSALLAAVGDVCLILSSDGVILDVAVSQAELANQGFTDWIGRRWAETLTIESQPKIIEMLGAAIEPGELPRWRQVNHPAPGGEVPVRYLVMPISGSDRLIAVGRNIGGAAAMQQRLIQTQQSLERDYIRLRHAETRYRLMFDMASEPVLVVDAETRRIREANPAAHRLLEADDGALIGTAVSGLISEVDRERLVAHLGAAEVVDDLPPVNVELNDRRGEAAISARLFRQARKAMLIVRIIPVDAKLTGDRYESTLSEVVERMPDSFVLADRDLKILTANSAFVELTEVPSAHRAIGEKLAQWLGRPGIDLELIVAQLREHGSVRNVATIMRGSAGAQEEIEVSGVVASMGNEECYGFTVRSVGRRLRETPAETRDVPRSVEQLTKLVGRMSLKEIVRESTDLVERLCIEAALAYTADNRASAAEILGVSRQSLYSKMHRHGLGNLVSNEG